MSAITPPLTSPKPYLIRAWHEWMIDNGLTPHILVMVDATVAVPREYVKNNEVVLNVGHEATGSLNLGNEAISFQARFAGRVREIVVPIDRVASIFARENGQGMVFEALTTDDAEFEEGDTAGADRVRPDAAGASTAGLGRAATPQPQSGGLTLVNKRDDSAKQPTKPAQAGATGADDEEPPPPATPGGTPASKGGGLKVVK